ncbi:AAA family ATPase [Sporosalibacterium faouarense]|uniref:AAA family ATPase n=1 Tax=Sporosalibacterium faouarense TaxID=516123 RepID=UPI00141C842B|nr:AAA family ATPase [Sporosalibacterium faouarense]MTI48127.1 AAA family ATPase [Bacillota bacterium]
MDNEILNLYRVGKVSLNHTFDQLFNSDSKELSKARSNKKIEDNDSIDLILSELHNLVGLRNVKELIDEIMAFVEIQGKRKKENLLTEPVVLHMVFKGNPGTGKTTVARIIGRLFKEMGVLEKGHLIEIERADIVGEYIGHTALKVRQQVKKALGGILFIDEAYSLARGGEKDFGKEAIDALVKSMEDNKDNLILILAGYDYEMEDFLRTNPGLKSRFPIHVDFKDYSVEELIEIGLIMAKNREYKLTNTAVNKLKQILVKYNDSYNSGNARLMRNIIEKSIRKQALRLKRQKYISKDDLLYLKAVDIEGNDKY